MPDQKANSHSIDSELPPKAETGGRPRPAVATGKASVRAPSRRVRAQFTAAQGRRAQPCVRIILDRGNRIAFASSQIETWLGLDYESVAGLPVTALLPELSTYLDAQNPLDSRMRKLQQMGSLKTYIFHANGSTLPATVSLQNGWDSTTPLLLLIPGPDQQESKFLAPQGQAICRSNTLKENTVFTEQNPLFPIAKANVEAQLEMLTALARETLNSTGKIVASNMHATRVNWEKSTASAKQMLATQDPQESLSLMTAHAQESLAAALSHGRNVADIVAEARNELTRELEAQSAESRRYFSAVAEQLAQKMPAGTQTGVTLLATSINKLNTGYEQWADLCKQSAAVMDKQLAAIADQIPQSANKRAKSQAARGKSGDAA